MAYARGNGMRVDAHESCGQCTACREGTAWLSRLLDKIAAGKGEKVDVDNCHQIARQMEMKTICALADGAAMPAKSYIEKFRADFDLRSEERRVGKECRCRGARSHWKRKTHIIIDG